MPGDCHVWNVCMAFLSSLKASQFLFQKLLGESLMYIMTLNMLCFRIVLPLLLDLLGSGRALVMPEMREAISLINGGGVAAIISPKVNQDGGPIAGCTCDWSMLTFITESSYEIGRVWLSKIVAKNTCEYGMKNIPVRCPGWKQNYVLKSTLMVHEKNGTCIFFPEKVIRAGFRDYFPTFGKRLHLETFPLRGSYPCYNCTCFGCCLGS